MEAHTAANVSVVQTTLSSSKSLSAASSPNRFALLATFTAWAAMWRIIAEQRADELQKTVEAAAAWRSQLRCRFAKTVPSTVSATTTEKPVTEDLNNSKSRVEDEVLEGGNDQEDGHDVELQRALEAAAAWRSKMQQSRSQSKVATTSKVACAQKGSIRKVDGSMQNLVHCAVDASVKQSDGFVSKGHEGGLISDLSENLPKGQVEITSDAHDAELQEALDAAAKWRSRFQSREHVQNNEAKECVAPSKNGSSHESNSPCDSKTKQGLLAILQGDLEDSGSTSTTASGDEGSCASSDSDASPSCWVFGAYLRDVSTISAEGVRSRGRRVRLHAGPWGRRGLCRRNEEVLVYVDVLAARAAGTEFRYSQRGLVLVEGVIPAACCRKMVMIKDGSVLYDRSPLEPERA